MAVVSIRNVSVQNAIAKWLDPFVFNITFECITPLSDDLEWKLIYVGSSSSTSFDQELDSCMVGPVPVGVNTFTFEADPPVPSKIPEEEVLGVTVLLLTASYREQEFVRVGYYVQTEYEEEEMRENPPEGIKYERLVRNVLVDKPRVTRVTIDWGTEDHLAPSSSSAQGGAAHEPAPLPPVPAPFMPEAAAPSSASSSFSAAAPTAVPAAPAAAPAVAPDAPAPREEEQQHEKEEEKQKGVEGEQRQQVPVESTA